MPSDYTCVICRTDYSGFGNNPWPAAEVGRCCDGCNAMVVIPLRLKNIPVTPKETPDAE